MSLTALLWAGLFAASALASFFNPLYGALGYMLEYYHRPALYWWGRDLPDLRWNLTISLVLAGTFLLRRNALPAVKEIKNTAFLLLLLQGLNVIVVTLVFAIRPQMSSEWAWQFWKMLIFYGLLIGVTRTRAGFDAICGAHILGCTKWGWDALDVRRVRGRLEDIGSGDTETSNTLAAHALTVVPLLVVWLVTEKDWRKRLLALVGLPLVLNMIVLCNSRGATLGFLAGGAVSFLLVRKGTRLKVAGAAIACVLGLYLLADPQFIERQATTASAEDNSATSRLALWAGGVRMVMDYPFGVGGKGYQRLSTIYASEVTEMYDAERSSHNTYVQTAADWGIQGLALFLAFIIVTLRLLHHTRRENIGSDWVFYRSLALEIGLISTLVAATFTTRFYGESIYWLSALSVALARMDLRERNERQTEAIAPTGSGPAPVSQPLTAARAAGAR